MHGIKCVDPLLNMFKNRVDKCFVCRVTLSVVMWTLDKAMTSLFSAIYVVLGCIYFNMLKNHTTQSNAR